jgi:hypothetical protein
MIEQTAIEKLHAAAALGALEFYVSQSENRGPELRCRIWDGFKFMARKDVEKIALEFNQAIAVDRAKWRNRMVVTARQAIAPDAA